MPSNIFLNERSLTVCFGGRCFCCEDRDCRLHAISSRGSLLVVEWQRWASRDRLRPGAFVTASRTWSGAWGSCRAAQSTGSATARGLTSTAAAAAAATT